MGKKDPIDTRTAVSTANRLIREALHGRWKLFLVSLVCMIGVAMFTGALAQSTRYIVNDVFVDDSIESAFWIASLVIGISIGKSIFQYANSVISVLFDRSVSAHYQKRIFRKLLEQDVSQFQGKHASTQMAKVKLFGKASGKTIVNVCNRLLTDSLTLFALFLVMLYQDPLMTLSSSIMIPLIFWLVANLSRKVREAANAETELTGAFFAVGAEALDGIKTVKSYQLEEKSKQRFEDAVEKLEQRLLGLAKITSATVPIMELLGGLVIGIFVIYASWQTVTYGKTPGEFTAFITAFLLAYQPAERVSKVWVELQKTLMQVGRMFELLDEETSSTVPVHTTLEGAVPSVTFRNVEFSYRRNVVALHDVSFSVEPGERIAIVGRSGAGKSTLIDLLQRFYDPTSGTVEIGGRNLADVSEAAIRETIALISQDVFLFDGTIHENILDGFPAATDTDVEKAAQLAQLDAFLESAPEGLDTGVGPNGRELSGGQKQRVGIARALVKRAHIYIFDEATGSLDSHNERQIMQALEEELKDKTLFFVTHRASTLAYVDRVLVLQDGRLVAFDTPDRLLEHNPEFQTLFEEEKPD